MSVTLKHPLYPCKLVVFYTQCGEEVVPTKRPIWALRVLSAYVNVIKLYFITSNWVMTYFMSVFVLFGKFIA